MFHYFGKIAKADEFNNLHPLMPKALAFLKRKGLLGLANGTYEIVPENRAVFAMVQETDLTPFDGETQHAEAHGRYIDIQAPLSDEETIGVAEIDPSRPDFAFDAERDVGFVDIPTEPRTLRPGEFAIFMPPNGAHVPCKSLSGPRHIKKVVIKILMEATGS